MAELETAEKFGAKLCGHIVTSLTTNLWRPSEAKAEALRLIEARDKAVALRVLDEFEARIREQFKRVDPAWRQLLPILLREARTKYQEKP